jgi:hypothetical protein
MDANPGIVLNLPFVVVPGRGTASRVSIHYIRNLHSLYSIILYGNLPLVPGKLSDWAGILGL